LLQGLVRYCRSGQLPLTTNVTLATDLALELAELSHTGAWLSYLFDLFAALREVPESPATLPCSTRART